MKHFRQFIFRDYVFDHNQKQLRLTYGLDDAITFTETYTFNFEFIAKIDTELLDRACQSLFFMAGVSYYKSYLPAEIVLEKGSMDQFEADFFNKTYQKGLGEFFYLNGLSPNTKVNFQPNALHLPEISTTNDHSGLLVGLGGGKDSLVSVELLRSQPKVATWSVGHRPQLEPLVEEINLPHFWVEREWDRALLKHREQGAMNGHVPISAIFACVGSVVAVLSGYRDVVVSNESSASEPTLHHQGIPVNHQHSKSLEFEQNFQAYVTRGLGGAIRYYSLLRPLSELRIAELFSELGFSKYRRVFSSCNKAFLHTSNTMSWCGVCPKCAFMFLMFTPFVPRDQLEGLFGGKNLLLDPELRQTYQQLLGIAGDRPFECVGEVKESRMAMRLAQDLYPELANYHFDIPSNYDFRALSPHSMPDEIFTILQSCLRRG